MRNHDRLSSLILAHWTHYHPSMLAQFKREDRLDAELEKTAQAFSSHLYELISVKQLAYHQAWEMTVEQFLLPGPSKPATLHPPATSG